MGKSIVCTRLSPLCLRRWPAAPGRASLPPRLIDERHQQLCGRVAVPRFRAHRPAHHPPLAIDEIRNRDELPPYRSLTTPSASIAWRSDPASQPFRRLATVRRGWLPRRGWSIPTAVCADPSQSPAVRLGSDFGAVGTPANSARIRSLPSVRVQSLPPTPRARSVPSRPIRYVVGSPIT